MCSGLVIRFQATWKLLKESVLSTSIKIRLLFLLMIVAFTGSVRSENLYNSATGEFSVGVIRVDESTAYFRPILTC